MGNSIYANVFFMLGGIAVMMFGMRTMGANLERIAGNNVKKMLGGITNNRLAGVGIGAAVTAIINSSAATTVMLVGFVNIGLITLTQAASVIMGANIGTTITAQILSLSGTDGVDIASIAALVAAAGMVMALFFKNDRINKIGYILLGLGFIFVGLRIMSTSVSGIIYESGELRPVFKTIFQKDHFPLLLVLIGIVFTALIQSSAALTGILIAIGGALKLETAVFIILGSNIGTCITALISSIGTSTSAKRTAIIHLLFNLFGCLICIAPLWIWGKEFGEFMKTVSGASIERQIANFHTLFNLLTTLILVPFTGALVKLATKIIPERKTRAEAKLTFAYIDDRFLETPPIAVGNTKREILRMAGIAKENINLCVEMLVSGIDTNSEIIKENENALNFLNRSITAYLTKLSGKNLSLLDERKVGSYYHVVIDLERVGDYAENITEYSAKLKADGVALSEDAKEELKVLTGKINDLFDISAAAFDKREDALLAKVDEIEESIDEYSAALELKHVDRLKQGACSAQAGSIYLQAVSNLERVGDHITNMAFSIKQYRHK
ncbi:MAG: Na/Pi cotransporter family protein [Clostridia bacterium]|nr:Na/Pi cotransporter family protein [Clostridia bacterium]